MTIYFKKSFLQCKEVKEFVKKSQLDEFKRRILEHLNKLEAKEKKRDGKVQKALVEQERLNKAGYPVGTVREWKGKKFIKTAPNKWRRKYDNEGKGTRQSIASIKRKVDACITVEELLQVVKQNKHRFTDENGRYLPVVKEMFDYVAEAHKKIKNMRSPERSAGGSKGGFVFSDLNNAQKARLAKEINSAVVAEIEPDTVPYNGGGKFEEAALAWFKGNPHGNAKTAIGEAEIDGRTISRDMHHGLQSVKYMKLQTLPVIKDILEKGTYLGYAKDFTDKPIDNHYFAGKIAYGGKEKIVFCRVKKNVGMPNKFHVHSVFTEDEIANVAKEAPPGTELSTLKGSVLYKFILQDVLKLPLKQEEEDSQRTEGPSPARLTGSPPDANITHSDSDVKQKTLNAAQIIQAAKAGERVREEDIDWGSLENDGSGGSAITKKNILGKVDWNALKEGGMEGGAARLVKQLYDSAGNAPSQDTPEAMRDYVRGLNLLKDRLEGAKTIKDVHRAMEKIQGEIKADEHNFSSRDIPGYSEKEAEVERLRKEWKDALSGIEELRDRAYEEEEAAEERVAERIKPFLVKNRVVMDGKAIGPRTKVRGSNLALQSYLLKVPEAKKAEFKELALAAVREEKAKSNEIKDRIRQIQRDADPLQDAYNTAEIEFIEWAKKARKEHALSNPARKAWLQLGDKFASIFNVGSAESKAFSRISDQAVKGKYDSWSWLKDSDSSDIKKAVAAALQRAFGNLGKSA